MTALRSARSAWLLVGWTPSWSVKVHRGGPDLEQVTAQDRLELATQRADAALECPRLPRRAGIDVFSREEVMALVRAAASERDAALYLTAAFTDLRLGELLALCWGDVDFDADTIRVERNYTAGREGTPKSGGGGPCR
jgi:integrase